MSVKDYIKRRDQSPLIFSTGNCEEIEIEKEDISLSELVEKVLDLTGQFYSLNSETKELETPPARNRSSFDIWRHVKYFNSDITIYQVMHVLADLIINKIRNETISFFCPDIKRRIFIFKKYDKHNYYTDFIARNDGTNADEYGIRDLHTWLDYEEE